MLILDISFRLVISESDVPSVINVLYQINRILHLFNFTIAYS